MATDSQGSREVEENQSGKAEDVVAATSSAEMCDDAVVYQLVRVVDDGSLVPATDAEIMQVLLGGGKIEAPLAGCTRNTESSASLEKLDLKISDIESSQGLSDSDVTHVDSRKLNARLEFIEKMLQKVKHEERLRLSGETLKASRKIEADTLASIKQHRGLVPSDGKTQIKNLVQNPASYSSESNGKSTSGLFGIVEAHSKSANKPTPTVSPANEPPSISGSDDSTLELQISLESLTMRQLQQVFRETFGRDTNFKDKRWLKRQLLVIYPASVLDPRNSGHEKLDGSCDAKEDCFTAADVCTSAYEQELPHEQGNQMDAVQSLSRKKRMKTLMELNGKDEHGFTEEAIMTKRIRKPTKRFIEEVSDTEARESMGKPDVISSRKSKILVSCMASSQDTDSMNSTEGPIVCKGGRSSPVANYVFMESQQIDLEYANMEVVCLNFTSAVRDRKSGRNICKPRSIPMRVPRRNISSVVMETMAMESSLPEIGGIFRNDSGSIVQRRQQQRIKKTHQRRMIHRAWSVHEVKKLVDGVATYGVGRWSEIKRQAFPAPHRTAVDLKDKWRNLLKASFAISRTESEQATSSCRLPFSPSAMLPEGILSQVRYLAEQHLHAGAKFFAAKLEGRIPKQADGTTTTNMYL